MCVCVCACACACVCGAKILLTLTFGQGLRRAAGKNRKYLRRFEVKYERKAIRGPILKLIDQLTKMANIQNMSRITHTQTHTPTHAHHQNQSPSSPLL